MDFLESEIEEILNIFREESDEQIQKLNKNLLKLEANPKDSTAISELFREAHSLKGASRMIGLNDIQNIAHKLEDVFGMAKENQLVVTSEIVDVLCKAVDCISSIVEESIKTRGQSSFDQVPDMIKLLETIINQESSETSVQNNISFKENFYSNKPPSLHESLPMKKPAYVDIKKLGKENKTLIIQIKVNIEKIKVFSSSSDAIEELLHFIIRLDSVIKTINNPRINGIIEEIKIKLEAALKGRGILNSDEVLEIEENFETFSSLFERLTTGLENNESYTQTESKSTDIIDGNLQIKQESKKEEDNTFILDGSIDEELKTDILNASSKNQSLNEDLKFIKKNIAVFSVHSQENLLKFDEVINKLNNFINKIENENIRNIIEKITELLTYSKEKNIPINNDVIEIIKESFETSILMDNSPFETEENPVLMLQRISVLLQMIKLSAPSNQLSATEEESNEETSSYEAISNRANSISQKLSTANTGTEILSKNTLMAENDNSSYEIKPGDSNTIKTLRVDTKKLDQLVNQVGELIIAKIKAKEHLSELAKMIQSVEEWHREWNKTKQYFKHQDKLHYRSADLPAGSSVYSQNKNLHVFFEENSSKLTGLTNKMNYLYKIIQEDDTRLDLIVNELEERIKSVRVLPLATIFHMFPRMVRDISREKNKNIEFVISGSETSVDKKIIEEIKSPLIHLIRNSIDHGIEDSETRIKNGKNPVGKIFLAAYHLENSVLIEIIDDGHGINIEAIKRKVLQKQLLSQEELDSMTEEQIMNIIFWSGFSTGETITDISGRGIGLDIVYTKISQLNGKVKIKSTLGEGCRVSIQLPVTMATIKSFLVEINHQKFAIPTSTIKTTLLISPESIFYKEGKQTIIVENTTVPICNLSDALDLPESRKKNKKLVVIVVQSEDIQVGFIVDKLIGDQEILHKNLSPPLLRVRNIAGVTTLGSGELCLILNIGDLVKSAYSTFGMVEKRLVTEKVPLSNDSSEKHILVVDDSLTTRILERNILKAAGYNVTVAVNGLEALTKITSEDFDLVVTDVEMPEINGFELTERLRSQEKFNKIPIILVTSLASEIDKRKGLNFGANAYLTKGNFNQDELLVTIRQLLS
ncbi:MAG: hybrid sensor histidine kinase/response regulator [bacterium]